MRGEFWMDVTVITGAGRRRRVAGRGSRGNGRARTDEGGFFGVHVWRSCMCAAYANPCGTPARGNLRATIRCDDSRIAIWDTVSQSECRLSKLAVLGMFNSTERQTSNV